MGHEGCIAALRQRCHLGGLAHAISVAVRQSAHLGAALRRHAWVPRLQVLHKVEVAAILDQVALDLLRARVGKANQLCADPLILRMDAEVSFLRLVADQCCLSLCKLGLQATRPL